jgi:mannose-6-phosphate isomerase-like protein (cupin superfamily)
MSRAGDIVENPITGERVVVRIGGDDTNGERLVCDMYVRPGGRVAGAHVHDTLSERFEVVAGVIGYELDGHRGLAGPGERIEVPPGRVHDWWNAGEEELHAVVEVWPCARFEQAIQTSFALAIEGRTNADGMPGLLQLAVIGQEFADVIRFTSPPRWIQRALFGVLAPIGRRRGLRAVYPHHRALLEQRSAAARAAATRVPPRG